MSSGKDVRILTLSLETLDPQAVGGIAVQALYNTLAYYFAEAEIVAEARELEARTKAIADYYQKARDPERQKVAARMLARIKHKLAQLWAAAEKAEASGSNQYEERYHRGTSPPTAADLGLGKAEQNRLNLLATLTTDDVESFIAESEDVTQKALLRLAAERKAAMLRLANAPSIGKLVNGDAIEVLDLIDDYSVDCIVTDPPYSTDVTDFGPFTYRWLPKALNKVKDTGRLFIFAGPYPAELSTYLSLLAPPPNHLRWGNMLIWHYKNTLGPAPTHTFKNTYQVAFYLYGVNAPPLTSPLLKDQTSVLEYAQPRGLDPGDRHPWAKPRQLIDHLLAVGTQEGDHVLDLFAGSGAIGASASAMGRTSLSVEIDKDAIAMAQGRGLHLEDLQ